MGKSLRGKECGKGICQRKDGLYYARFVDKTGKRHEKYLPTLPEARNWIEESKYADAPPFSYAIAQWQPPPQLLQFPLQPPSQPPLHPLQPPCL